MALNTLVQEQTTERDIFTLDDEKQIVGAFVDAYCALRTHDDDAVRELLHTHGDQLARCVAYVPVVVSTSSYKNKDDGRDEQQHDTTHHNYLLVGEGVRLEFCDEARTVHNNDLSGRRSFQCVVGTMSFFDQYLRQYFNLYKEIGILPSQYRGNTAEEIADYCARGRIIHALTKSGKE